MKLDINIAKELSKIPKATTSPRPEIYTNRICSCGRKIGEKNAYYIKIDSGELPEVFCEMCVSETN